MAPAGTKRATVASDPSPATWPADAVERRPVAALVPYARNARTHSDAQVAQIAASIREWGWTTPVLVDESGGIIAGHGRVMAAKTLGIADVPVMVARGWSDAQKKAYVLADNKLALNAGWDEALLRVELEDLKFEGFDLGLTGFAELELDDIFGAGAEAGDSSGGPAGAGSLSAQFGISPFTVLNAREGWWQDRKAAWIAIGIRSEVGRGGTPETSARVGPDDEATYRTIGGRKPNAIPGGGSNADRPGQATKGGGSAWRGDDAVC